MGAAKVCAFAATNGRTYGFQFSPDGGKHWYPLNVESLHALVKSNYGDGASAVIKQIESGEEIVISRHASVRRVFLS
jgi:hypothetical protein